jgi:hypothetical protein
MGYKHLGNTESKRMNTSTERCRRFNEACQALLNFDRIIYGVVGVKDLANAISVSTDAEVAQYKRDCRKVLIAHVVECLNDMKLSE